MWYALPHTNTHEHAIPGEVPLVLNQLQDPVRQQVEIRVHQARVQRQGGDPPQQGLRGAEGAALDGDGRDLFCVGEWVRRMEWGI